MAQAGFGFVILLSQHLGVLDIHTLVSAAIMAGTHVRLGSAARGGSKLGSHGVLCPSLQEQLCRLGLEREMEAD